ncbi:hypothetical protein [Geothrix sp. PMB-07]|uniref:hypothetical protein n=1 Tax=Geothrix sp. PMB-07 TaxID=3068640 RepID=UPI0027421B5F|nr:hypothetical protein [Geothrix sp. PMB-07]WLT30505.1 hypothetical protein Q9293_12340 [Geothrix sp. PMB-07]
MRFLRPLTLGATLALLPLGLSLALTLGCDHKSSAEAESKDLTKKVAEAESATGKAQEATKAQSQALAKAGLQPNPDNVQLTEAQRALLEKRVKDEKNNGVASLLQEILDRDKQIADLTAKAAKLRADLPKPQIAGDKDNHFAMAVRFLKSKGLSEEKAKTLAARANLMEELQPGWQVYQQYVDGVYLTTVTQGKATIGPSEYVRSQRAALQRDYDDTMLIAHGLADEVQSLVAQRQKVQEEVDTLQSEKTSLLSQVNELSTLSQSQKAKLNAMHYLVGRRKQLEEDGVIVVPVFAKDRMGPKALAAKFDKDLALDGPSPELTIKAADLGLKTLSKVSVIPGSLEKDRHYTVTLSEDRTSAKVRILDPERLRNDRVVFAVAD